MPVSTCGPATPATARERPHAQAPGPKARGRHEPKAARRRTRSGRSPGHRAGPKSPRTTRAAQDRAHDLGRHSYRRPARHPTPAGKDHKGGRPPHDPGPWNASGTAHGRERRAYHRSAATTAAPKRPGGQDQPATKAGAGGQSGAQDRPPQDLGSVKPTGDDVKPAAGTARPCNQALAGSVARRAAAAARNPKGDRPTRARYQAVQPCQPQAAQHADRGGAEAHNAETDPKQERPRFPFMCRPSAIGRTTLCANRRPCNSNSESSGQSPATKYRRFLGLLCIRTSR